MFTIGDKVVYPMHGAGIIEGLEERIVLGEQRSYYILRIPQGDIKIMIPTDNTENIGVRSIICQPELANVRITLKGKSSEMAQIWNRRYRDNMEKLKTGNIEDVAEVVRDLMRVDNEKKLSTGEKKMLTNAKHILMSELILVSDKCEEELNNLIEQLIME
ncbi:MAG: CarD family transcriptional regulator [Clostridiales Family XIII bacterium]|nr:CarD family transcriptional regulator [Clostridiales Family XIII bacterium]